jgi:glyceraldehyde 3-phosphate dehydrogenase
MTPENIIVRGHKIKVLKERDPGNLPWKILGAEVILESTGFFTSRDNAELHITKGWSEAGAYQRSGKKPDVTLCLGVNDEIYEPSNISCFRTRAAHQLPRVDWPRCCTTISES